MEVITEIIMNSVIDIVKDLPTQLESTTDSLISLFRPFDTVKLDVEVKLSEDDLRLSVIIALEIINYAFLK
jgi:hypothetical protein